MLSLEIALQVESVGQGRTLAVGQESERCKPRTPVRFRLSSIGSG
jgi:hypothetical protein